MEANPKLKLKLTILDYLIEILGLLLFSSTWIFIISIYKSLPDIIPIHYNAYGTADNFGKKWMILSLPIVSTVLFIGLTLLNYFPESFNYPTKINEDNALIQYTYATRLIRYLKLVIVFIFGILLYQTTRYPLNQNDGLGIWFLPMFLGLIFIPLIFYVLKSVKPK
jgi:uncharacterized membrane protein